VPEPAPSLATKRAKVDDGKMTTSMRIEPEKLEALKIIAARERIRVNDLVMQGIDHVIALRRQGRAA
jgi:predicted HicB family RNase H-like nuclease